MWGLIAYNLASPGGIRAGKVNEISTGLWISHLLFT
jgi:hypothetical protein